MKKTNIKHQLYFLGVIFFAYVVLFEFILPINRVLPKPSILMESFIHVWQYYHLFSSLLITAGIVYSSIAIGYMLIYAFRKYLVNLLLQYSDSLNVLKIFRYIPAFFYAILFIFWFERSYLAEYLFGLISFLFLFVQKLNQELANVGDEYISYSKSLIKNRGIEEVYWRCSLPKTFNYLGRIHFYLWTLMLIYEFVSNSNGLGSVYRLTLEYSDFGGIFALAILISIVILIGSKLIEYLKTKIAFWEA